MLAVIRPVAAAAALFSLGAAAVAADPQAVSRAPRPELVLPESGASGQRALDLLGERLPAVAASYGKTPEAMREILNRDRRIKLDARGRVFVVDDLEQPLPPSQHAATLEAQGATPAALGDTFKLHSRPKARRTVYLDFNGAVLKNTVWNNNGASTINAVAYDIDGHPEAFSDTELQRIQYIWQRVAEDYSPFDVDVTTEEPPADRLTRTDTADEVFGTTVLVTNHTGVYDCSCGGVAYIGVFDATSDFDKPALVFYDMLAHGDERDVAEAISHESGHNFGLFHDGTSTQAYYPGHGSGPTGWAPIMGVGYYQPLVQWSAGEYADANNTQDDIQVIQDNGGPLRKDDHGNKIEKATPLAATVAGTKLTLAGSGVIERRSDKDMFSFSAAAGAASFSANPDSRSGNLDILLKLLDSKGKVIATASPTGALAATLNYTLPAAGTYYLVINGVGEGDVHGTGYSDYGSLGQYTISGSAIAQAK